MNIRPPDRIPWLLRPGLWLARRMTGKDPLPARLLAHVPKAALAAGVFELAAPGSRDLDARTLAIARIVASVAGGCPFCVDMNAATWKEAGLSVAELEALLRLDETAFASLGVRESLAARYALALSRTPVAVEPALEEAIQRELSPREIVVLAFTIGQVNFWTRFNQGLGVPAAGFFDESVCRLPPR